MRFDWVKAGVVAVLVLVVLLLLSAVLPGADAATRDKVTRAEFNSLTLGDSPATVARKLDGQGYRVTERSPLAIFIRARAVPQPALVLVGAQETRRYRTGPQRYYEGDCHNVQLTFNSGQLARKENWSNVCQPRGSVR